MQEKLWLIVENLVYICITMINYLFGKIKIIRANNVINLFNKVDKSLGLAFAIISIRPNVNTTVYVYFFQDERQEEISKKFHPIFIIILCVIFGHIINK